MLLLAVCIYIGLYRKRKVKDATLLPTEESSILPGQGICFLFVPHFFAFYLFCLVLFLNEHVLH